MLQINKDKMLLQVLKISHKLPVDLIMLYTTRAFLRRL